MKSCHFAKTATLARIATIAACFAVPAARAEAPLPVEAFATPPQVESVVLSPSGQSYAVVMHRGDATIIATRKAVGPDPAVIAIQNEAREYIVNWVRFVREDRLVASVSFVNRRGWDQVRETRLVAFDRDGGHLKVLVEPSGLRRSGNVAQVQDQVIDWLPEDGHHILLQAPTEFNDVSVAVIKVDVDTAGRTLVHNARSQAIAWLTDAAHRPRVSLVQDGTDIKVQVCDPDGDNWRTTWTFRLFSRDAVTPLGFGADPNLLFVNADLHGRRAVYEVDLRDPALPRRLVLGNERIDIGGSLVVDPASHRALGVGNSVFDRSGIASSAGFYWDPDTKALVKAIDTALPGQANRLLQFSGDGSRYLVFTSGNGVPGRFMYGNRETGHLDEIAAQYPGLPPARMSRKTAFTIRARDGLTLPAFLALPKGAADKNLPTVILPHGGPIANDSLDFDPWVEFLASRGYAVLQVQFRGSTGFGNGFMAAGLKRWGLEMQDDLSDSVKWLVDRGTADPSRVCIVGASYGGYAALMGGAKTPELYRCVVAFAGVSDLIDLGNTTARFVNGRAIYESMVGSPWDDRAQLKETSPRRLAAQFRAPVLLVHGTADVQVPYDQSEEMADALKSAGKDVRLVTQKDGDHQLSYPAYRIEFFRELDAFLAKNLAAPEASAGMAPETAHP